MSFHLKLILFLSFLFISTIVNLAFIVKLMQYGKEKLEWVNHTHEVIVQTERFLSDLQDAETGQRGFLLTKNSTYLEPYNSGIIMAKEHFKNMQALTSDNKEQQKRLVLIKKNMELKFEELDKTIKLALNNNNNKAIEIVNQNIGKEYMDEIRGILKEFINIENTLLEKRETAYMDNRATITMLITFEIIFFLFLAFLTFIFLNKNLFSPLKLLLLNTQKMEEGAKVEFTEVAQNDEIGRLLSSFYKMYETVNSRTKELKNYRDQLEVRVKEEVQKNERQHAYMLQQSRQAQMGEMISMIAHQWRQPLSTISVVAMNLKLISELEKFDLGKKQEAQKYEADVNSGLDDVDKLVQSLNTTINDFRNFYKPNKESVSVKLEDVTLKSLNIIRVSLTNTDIKIIEKYNLQEEIELYESELMQVVLNILQNAHDCFKEKNVQDPYIKIIIENRTISISNNAGAIPEDIIDKIFDPYFSTKSEKNGTGLGLYMSKTIVEEHHNGKLTVQSKDDIVCFTIEVGMLNKTIRK